MFENYISLGGKCYVAGSMSKIGIRDCAGPFDWYVSDFKAVLEVLDNDFSDFLNRKNLVEDLDGTHMLRDVKYGFQFPHEIKTSLEADYDGICEKYRMRIQRFREKTYKKSCFLRTILPDEVDWVKNHLEYINNIIQRRNKENEIIYLVVDPEDEENFEYPFFAVKDLWVKWLARRGMRALFDTNQQLQDFLIQNYDENKRLKNLLFDLQAEEKVKDKIEYNYALINQLEDLDVDTLDIPKQVVIYGAGKVGKKLCKMIAPLCRVLCLVDRDSKETEYNGIPIIHYDEFIKSDFRQELVIVTPAYMFDKIKNCLKLDNIYNVISVVQFIKL